MSIEEKNTQLNAAPSKLRRFQLNRFARWFTRRLPKGLYGRALLIIITPMVLLQSVITFVFMERHWQLVTERLSRAVTADIAAIVEIIETYPQDPEYAQITKIARDRLGLNIAILPPDPFPPVVGKPFFSLLDDTLRQEITQQVGRSFWIDTVGDSDILEIRVRLEPPKENVLRIFVRRNRAYASNSHIFLAWMFGTSLVLLIIAVLFMRNQIRPIQQLSRAAESFGKGQTMPENFQVRGSREVRQASLAFLQMRERIERQIEQRTTMLTGVSHDLRTILTRFKLQLALIRQTDGIRELQSDVDDMQRMLEGYIEFARGETEGAIEQVNVMDILSRHRNEAELRGKVYKIDCDANVQMDTRLEAFGRLVANIVANAFRYADVLKVGVSVGQTRLHMTFDDDGPGIAEEYREDVFKPFMRLDESRNLDQSGTGLGLSIALDIARNHGGNINLYDSPLGGLRVIVTLPH